MTQPINNGSNIPKTASALERFLNKTYSLYLVAHQHHWNVEGKQFVTLHTLFETQYRDAFDALDEIAERIRMLGIHVSALQASDEATEIDHSSGDSDTRAKAMLKQLISLHQDVILAAKSVIEQAEAAKDPVSEDLAIARIASHEKHIWILNSMLR